MQYGRAVGNWAIILLISLTLAIFCGYLSVTTVYAGTDDAFAESRWNDEMKQNTNRLGDNAEWNIRIPILVGVSVLDLNDTWGDARSNGRTHEGIDIFAPRGTFVVSPTRAVVASVSYGPIGGNAVFTVNPGGERYFFAHLDDFAPGLSKGDVLEAGDLIGYVGNTGNASHANPHLHFGIYHGGASNPFPRLTKTFSNEERVRYLSQLVSSIEDAPPAERSFIVEHQDLFDKLTGGEELSAEEMVALTKEDEVTTTETTVLVEEEKPTAVMQSIIGHDLTIGARGEDVVWLQKFLVAQAAGERAAYLGRSGTTGYFGPITHSALAEYQRSVGISPASGYYGAKTRSQIASGDTGTQEVLVATPKTPAVDTAIFTRNLRTGSRGEDVRALQKYLNDSGFTVAQSGVGSPGRESTYFGPATARALAKFQAAKQISPSAGYFGPITRIEITGESIETKKVAEVFDRDLAVGDRGEDVRTLQSILNTKGYTVAASGNGSPGNESMYFGPATKRALSLFQKDHGIAPASGYFGPVTRSKLDSL